MELGRDGAERALTVSAFLSSPRGSGLGTVQQVPPPRSLQYQRLFVQLRQRFPSRPVTGEIDAVGGAQSRLHSHSSATYPRFHHV